MSALARFPFSAVVGQSEARLALLLAAVDPGIGGVLLRGDKGAAKSTLARGLAGMLPGGAPFVELPLGATEDRVLGTIDPGAAQAGGTAPFRPGLLAAAHGGVLYVDEVNLLPDPLVDVLLDVAGSGINRVERDGVSHSHPARFVLVGSMNPEEGELRPQLLDRFGLSVEIKAPTDPQLRAEIVRRRLTHDAGGKVGGGEGDIVLRARLAASMPADLPDTVVDFACRLAVGVGAEGLRADLVLCRAAAAFAGWEGREVATAADVERVAAFALGHRRRRRPFDPPVLGENELERALGAARQSFADAYRQLSPPAAPVLTAEDSDVAATGASPAVAPVSAPEGNGNGIGPDDSAGSSTGTDTGTGASPWAGLDADTGSDTGTGASPWAGLDADTGSDTGTGTSPWAGLDLDAPGTSDAGRAGPWGGMTSSPFGGGTADVPPGEPDRTDPSGAAGWEPLAHDDTEDEDPSGEVAGLSDDHPDAGPGHGDADDRLDAEAGDQGDESADDAGRSEAEEDAGDSSLAGTAAPDDDADDRGPGEVAATDDDADDADDDSATGAATEDEGDGASPWSGAVPAPGPHTEPGGTTRGGASGDLQGDDAPDPTGAPVRDIGPGDRGDDDGAATDDGDTGPSGDADGPGHGTAAAGDAGHGFFPPPATTDPSGGTWQSLTSDSFGTGSTGWAGPPTGGAAATPDAGPDTPRGSAGTGWTETPTDERAAVLRDLAVRPRTAGGIALADAVATATPRRDREAPAAPGDAPGDTALRARTVGRTVVLAVDASGSVGTHRRVEAATGAVLGLLADAYLRRDRVSLVTFRGDTAEVVLPPTASVELARTRLAEVPTGGVTPLAEGISAGLSLARRAEADGWPALFVLITDGRATGNQSARERADAAAAEVAADGVDVVVIDAEDGPNRLGLAEHLATTMAGRCVRPDELSAAAVEGAVRDALH